MVHVLTLQFFHVLYSLDVLIAKMFLFSLGR